MMQNQKCIGIEGWDTDLLVAHLWVHRLREWHDLTLGRLHRRYLQVISKVQLRNRLETFAQVWLHSAWLPCLQVQDSCEGLDTKRYDVPGSFFPEGCFQLDQHRVATSKVVLLQQYADQANPTGENVTE